MNTNWVQKFIFPTYHVLVVMTVLVSLYSMPSEAQEDPSKFVRESVAELGGSIIFEWVKSLDEYPYTPGENSTNKITGTPADENVIRAMSRISLLSKMGIKIVLTNHENILMDTDRKLILAHQSWLDYFTQDVNQDETKKLILMAIFAHEASHYMVDLYFLSHEKPQVLIENEVNPEINQIIEHGLVDFVGCELLKDAGLSKQELTTAYQAYLFKNKSIVDMFTTGVNLDHVARKSGIETCLDFQL